MSGDALEQALALQRAPIQRFAVRDRPLARNIEVVIQLAAVSQPLLSKTAARLCVAEASLLEAVRFYLQQALFEGERDAYRTLAVMPDAETDRIREHYRWLQRWLHPDRHAEEWDSLFTERLNWAWQQLRTEAARNNYDAQRVAARAARNPSPGGNNAPLANSDWAPVPVPIAPPRNLWLKRGALALSLASCFGLLYLAMTREDAPSSGSLAALTTADNDQDTAAVERHPADLPVDGSTQSALPRNQNADVSAALQAGARTVSSDTHAEPAATPTVQSTGSAVNRVDMAVADARAPKPLVSSSVVPPPPAPKSKPSPSPAQSTSSAPPPAAVADAAPVNDPPAAPKRPAQALATEPAKASPNANSVATVAVTPIPTTPAPTPTATKPPAVAAPDPVVSQLVAVQEQPKSLPQPEHAESGEPDAKRIESGQVADRGQSQIASHDRRDAKPVAQVAPAQTATTPALTSMRQDAPVVSAVPLQTLPASGSAPAPGVSPRLGTTVAEATSAPPKQLESAAVAPPTAPLSAHAAEPTAPPAASDLLARIDRAREHVRAIVAYFRRVDSSAPAWPDARSPHSAAQAREALRARIGVPLAAQFALDPPRWNASSESVAIDAGYHVTRDRQIAEQGRFRIDMVWHDQAWQLTRVDVVPRK